MDCQSLLHRTGWYIGLIRTSGLPIHGGQAKGLVTVGRDVRIITLIM